MCIYMLCVFIHKMQISNMTACILDGYKSIRCKAIAMVRLCEAYIQYVAEDGREQHYRRELNMKV